MRIKNARELHLRARSHAANDHVRQGTYGYGSLNGHAEFKGCAVGCLSTPHRLRELRRFLKQNLAPWGIDGGYEVELTLNEEEQRAILVDEFGMCPGMIKVAEGLFETQPTHGAAIEFVKRFAEALQEGAWITDTHISEWENETLGCSPPTWGDLQELLREECDYNDRDITEVTDSFIEYLAGFTPNPDQLALTTDKGGP